MAKGPFTEEEDRHLLQFCDLPMSMICRRIGRTSEGCERRLKELVDSGAAFRFAAAKIGTLKYRIKSGRVRDELSADMAEDSLAEWNEKLARWSTPEAF